MAKQNVTVEVEAKKSLRRLELAEITSDCSKKHVHPRSNADAHAMHTFSTSLPLTPTVARFTCYARYRDLHPSRTFQALPETLLLRPLSIVLFFDVVLADYTQENLVQRRLTDGVILKS